MDWLPTGNDKKGDSSSIPSGRRPELGGTAPSADGFKLPAPASNVAEGSSSGHGAPGNPSILAIPRTQSPMDMDTDNNKEKAKGTSLPDPAGPPAPGATDSSSALPTATRIAEESKMEVDQRPAEAKVRREDIKEHVG